MALPVCPVQSGIKNASWAWPVSLQRAVSEVFPGQECEGLVIAPLPRLGGALEEQLKAESRTLGDRYEGPGGVGMVCPQVFLMLLPSQTQEQTVEGLRSLGKDRDSSKQVPPGPAGVAWGWASNCPCPCWRPGPSSAPSLDHSSLPSVPAHLRCATIQSHSGLGAVCKVPSPTLRGLALNQAGKSLSCGFSQVGSGASALSSSGRLGWKGGCW